MLNNLNKYKKKNPNKIIQVNKNCKIIKYNKNEILLTIKKGSKIHSIFYNDYDFPIGKYIKISRNNDLGYLPGITQAYTFINLKDEEETLKFFNLNRKNLEKIIKENN
jgi:hypothetical protein